MDVKVVELRYQAEIASSDWIVISMERNPNMSRKKHFPGVHKFEKPPSDFDVKGLVQYI